MEQLAATVEDGDYYICTTPNCPVAYYGSQVFPQSELRVPIWYKHGADPKYICYCNQVTEEQIIEAVQARGARTLGDVVKLTGAMRNGRCLVKNPTGKCCGETIKQVIAATLRAKD